MTAHTFHFAYAEVQVQFAGESGFAPKTTQGGQTAANTVVVGQKVQAKVETSDKIHLNKTYGVEWAYPSGGNAIRDYITDDSEGRVVELSETYFNNGTDSYYTDNFVFYYTATNFFNVNKLGGLTATFNLVDDNGKSYYGKTATASYYVDTPTVNTFESMFPIDFVQIGEPTIDIRDINGNPWLQFGLVEYEIPPGPSFLLPGIMWHAEVAPTPYAGGQIAFVQLENTVKEVVYPSGLHKVRRTPLSQYYLDNNFPYYS
jgi:hypothetical protein